MISVPGAAASFVLAGKEFDPRVIKFLGLIGTGVTGHRQRESEDFEDLQTIKKGIKEPPYC